MISALALGIAFILWGALNVWTGKVYNWFDEVLPGVAFATRAEHAQVFWVLVSFKFVAGTGILAILGEEHWKQWRRGVAHRRSGVLTDPSQARMAEVERLVRAGERVMAIRLYREIHHVGLAEARKVIDDLHTGA